MVVSIAQSKNVRGHAGEPLPTVWKNFDELGVSFHRGQLVLVVAPPGVGKSILTLSYVLQAGVRTLYFSADSDPADQISRATAVLTGAHHLTAKAEFVAGTVRPEITNAQVFWSFNPQPTLRDIDEELDALYEAYLWEPEVIVIDNATNVLSGFAGNEDDPFGGLEALMDHLNGLARRTGACVITTHHTKAEYNDANLPAPLSGIKGQIARVPQIVLTIGKRPKMSDFAPETLMVAPVKNRGRKSDPTGKTFAELEFDGDHMQLKDLK